MAGTNAKSEPISSPVFIFRSNLGKFELEISTRIRCPFLNRFEVAHRSISYSLTAPGCISDAGWRGFLYRALTIPSVRFLAYPDGSTSTSLAVKSVSDALLDANRVTFIHPVTSVSSDRGGVE